MKSLMHNELVMFAGPFFSASLATLLLFIFTFEFLVNVQIKNLYIDGIQINDKNICNQACENRACGYMKFDYFSNFYV